MTNVKALFRVKHPTLGQGLIDAGVLLDCSGAAVYPTGLYHAVTSDFTKETTTCWLTSSRAPAWTLKIEVKQ